MATAISKGNDKQYHSVLVFEHNVFEWRRMRSNQRELEEFRSKLGEPLMYFDYERIYYGIVAVYAESRDEDHVTYRLYFDDPDEEAHVCKVPTCAGWDRTATLLKVAIADIVDWDEPDDYWMDTFTLLRAHEGWDDVVYEVTE